MVVRMRANRSHRNNRRSHFALTSPRFSTCKDCGVAHLRHRVCTNCGKYRGRTALDFKAKLEKKVRNKATDSKQLETKN